MKSSANNHDCRRNGDRRMLHDFWSSMDKEVRLDSCIAYEVAVINHSEHPTLASCCGHGRYKKTIVVATADGEAVEILSGKVIPRKRRFYVKDADGFYFIPEVECHG